MSFLSQKLVQAFLVFFDFSKFLLLSAGRMRFFKNKAQKEDNHYHFESKLGPTMLRNMLGPIFDSTLDQFLTQPF